VLTPGPHNETYFEHVYLARYLGFLLLEGGDLVVRDGRVMVSTVVRTDADRCAMAPFRQRLSRSSRARCHLRGSVCPVLSRPCAPGGISMVNALGTGVLESRALMGFLPQVDAEALYGRDLKLPHVATWWCGQQSEREHVLAISTHWPSPLRCPVSIWPRAIWRCPRRACRMRTGIAIEAMIRIAR
jgi:uncharacterized circularly permuted ATP-grasp superfamily protein